MIHKDQNVPNTCDVQELVNPNSSSQLVNLGSFVIEGCGCEIN